MTSPVGIDGAEPVGLGETGDPSMGAPMDDLPMLDQAEFSNIMQGQRLPGFTSEPTTTLATTDGVRAKIVAEARKYEGVPYVWGGTSNTGWDCSGMVQWVLGRFGIDVPRLSSQQALYGERINDQSRARPGDLVAWNNGSRNGGPEAEHIAVYLGDGLIFEAPRPGVPSRIRKLGRDEGDMWFVGMSY